MIWLIGIGIALAAGGCSESWTSDQPARPRRRDAGTDIPPPPPEDGGSPDSPPETADARRACPRGAYSVLARPGGTEGACQISDFEIRQSSTSGEEIFGVCRPPLNRTFAARFGDSPMSPLGTTIGERVPPYTSGRRDFSVPYLVAPYAAGSYLISSTSEETPFLSAVTCVTPAGARTAEIDSIESPTVPPVSYRPHHIIGLADGESAILAGTDAGQDDRGIVFRVPIGRGYPDTRRIGTPTATSGARPAAIAKLNGNLAAVTNESCTGGRPCVDVIDRSDTGSMSLVAESYQLNIPGIIESKRMATTSDYRYLVNASPSGGVSIVDRVSRSEAVVSLPADAQARPVRFTAVKGMKAYLSATDTIYIVDFSNPATPRLEKEIYVGKDLGPIGVHSSGTIIIAITDLCEEGTSSGARWNDLVAIDPNSPVHGARPIFFDGGMPDEVPAR